ncbi:MAG: hypothetical protein ACK2UP_19655 [Candidatus Promineifilaceae bacterium]|jgi:hypothetical protein
MKILTTLLIALLLTACTGTSSNEPQAVTADSTPPMDEAILHEAQSYVDEMGITLDEALARLEIQSDDAIGTLQTQLQQSEPGTFAGLWLQHQPQFRVVVAFTGNGQETIAKYVSPDNPLSTLIEVRPAQYTYAQLQADQEEVVRYLETIGLPASVSIMVMENRVVLDVSDQAAFAAALAEAGLSLPDSVVVNAVYAPPDDPPPDITPVPGVFMPQLKQRDVVFMEALIVGKLVVEDGCLRVRSENDSHLVIWQADYFLTGNHNTLEILDETGAAVARIGDMIYLGGGEQNAVDDNDLRKPVPETCDGPYWRMGELLPDAYIPHIVADLPVATSSTDGWPRVAIPETGLTITYPDGWFVHDASKAMQITPNAQPTWSSFFDPDELHGGPTFDLLYNLNRQVGSTPAAEIENIIGYYGSELEPLRPPESPANHPEAIVGVYRFTNDEEQMALLVGAVPNPAADAPQSVIAMSSVVEIRDRPQFQPLFEAVLGSIQAGSLPSS